MARRTKAQILADMLQTTTQGDNTTQDVTSTTETTESTETKQPTPPVKTILDDFQKESVETVKACITLNSPVLLVGETGLGKTTLIAELAKAQGKNLTRLSVHSGITSDEILGKWLALNGSTVWQDGLLVQAMKQGDWIVFDEINACPADVLFALHSLLDDDRKVTLVEKDGSVIHPHPDFRFFATMNPVEDYAGTKELNMAFFSRFTAVIKIEPFAVDTEIGILQRKGIRKQIATELVMMANSLRNLKAKDEIVYFCGTRDLIHAGNLIKAGATKDYALNFAIINKASKDDQELIRSKGLVKPILSDQDRQIEQLKAEISTFSFREQNLVTQVTTLKNDLKKAQVDLATAKTQTNNGVQLNDKALKALKILGVVPQTPGESLNGF